MKNEVRVYPDSPEAATFKTVEGWVSRNGFFYGKDERIARYAGSTHSRCEMCGKDARKGHRHCDSCEAVKSRERFLKLPVVEWDEVGPLYLRDSERYFWDLSEIEDYAADEGKSVADLELLICEPHHPSEFDPNSEWYDFLPEDGEVQDADVLKAVDELNKALAKAKPFCWMPGDKRVELKP